MTIDPPDEPGRDNPIRVALLGGGVNSAVGYAHRTAIELDGIFSLVSGCFSDDRSINRDSARQYGVADDRVHDDIGQLLDVEAGEIDAAIILTPTPLHHAHTLQCIEANVPVICEKSLGLNSAEVSSIRDRVHATNSFLAAIYNYTGYPMLRELKDMIARGMLGKVQQIHIEMPQESFLKHDRDGRPPRPQEWRQRDGEVPTLSLDLGIHLHHIVHFLCGERPQRAVATENRFGAVEEVVDNVMGTIEYSGDVFCNIWYSKTALGHRNGLRVRVFGSGGSAEWFQQEPETLLFTDLRGSRQLLDRSSMSSEVACLDRYNRFKAGHPSGFIEAFANHYQDIATAYHAHRARRPARAQIDDPYVAGVDIALEGMQLLEALTQSAQQHQWITLK